MSIERQGTVAEYDPGSRAGEVLLDDGSRLAFPGAALDPAVLLLRRGQRVRLVVAAGTPSPAVTAVTLVTFPLPAG